MLTTSRYHGRSPAETVDGLLFCQLYDGSSKLDRESLSLDAQERPGRCRRRYRTPHPSPVSTPVPPLQPWLQQRLPSTYLRASSCKVSWTSFGQYVRLGEVPSRQLRAAAAAREAAERHLRADAEGAPPAHDERDTVNTDLQNTEVPHLFQ